MTIQKYKVVYSPEALFDIKSIYNYIAIDLNEKTNAISQTNRIRQKIRGLDTFPEKYEAVDWEPWKEMGMHRVPVDNYVIYYLANHDKKTVTVVRIFYGGRDIRNII